MLKVDGKKAVGQVWPGYLAMVVVQTNVGTGKFRLRKGRKS